MTSLFIYLLWTQLDKRGNVVAAASSAVVVVACKLANLMNVAVPLAAVVGVAVAMFACARSGQAGGVQPQKASELGRKGGVETV